MILGGLALSMLLPAPGAMAGWAVLVHSNDFIIAAIHFKSGQVVPLTQDDLGILRDAAGLDWSGVESAIFGMRFEWTLDFTKRHQLGAQCTSPEDIQEILEPVIFRPLRREWEQVKARADAALARYEARHAWGSAIRRQFHH